MRKKPMASGNSKKRQETEGRLRVEHVFPDGQRLQFANHVTVQHTNEGEFTISFYEIFQPVFLGSEEDIKKKLASLDGTVPANCISRIVISAARMPNLIGALAANYETYEKDTEKSTKKSAGEQGDQKHAS